MSERCAWYAIVGPLLVKQTPNEVNIPIFGCYQVTCFTHDELALLWRIRAKYRQHLKGFLNKCLWRCGYFSNLDSSSTISSWRTIRSWVSLAHESTTSGFNSLHLPLRQISCWILIRCIMNPCQQSTLIKHCKRNAYLYVTKARVCLNQALHLQSSILSFQSWKRCTCLNPNTFVLPPLCQALLRVQWGQVVRQVQGVHGLHWYQELPVSQAHPERREEKITKHPNEALFVDCFLRIYNVDFWNMFF